ncbi:TIGR00730 family Rossman fold protein [Paenibacillus dendritiformis]|uniref:LOG family protein n=1 Tax=Paenibacillus dendritiformis TaxID=130049 RepID=UPI0010593FB3|nr:TIGR00730 family Rossman fold protein [Paenibacillus dendritiformis]TDL57777.1 TIGR00730 family Rossman fold protein [Paenibacillus dendritiformis]
MKKICVFAGSNLGNHPDFAALAKELGQALAEQQFELVYGGSTVGLMGEVANEMLRLGGRVTGVMPRGLFRGELMHSGLTEFIEVADMHERKATMHRLSDTFISLPGGLGTFEELFEALSWAQLGIHKKPIGVLNIQGYFTPMIEMIRHSIQAGFARAEHEQLLLSSTDPRELLSMLESYKTPEFGNKWNQLD